jgi:hypothetical protein
MTDDADHRPHAPETLAILEKRKIEGEILKHVFETARASHGEKAARALIAEAVRRSAIQQGERFAAAQPEGPSLEHFIETQELWTRGGALEIETIEKGPDVYAFNVTRCRYAETYRAMGLGEIGPLLSCQRDHVFCEGYDKRLKLTRTQTIMEGASHCDFRYRYVEEDKA